MSTNKDGNRRDADLFVKYIEQRKLMKELKEQLNKTAFRNTVKTMEAEKPKKASTNKVKKVPLKRIKRTKNRKAENK